MTQPPKLVLQTHTQRLIQGRYGYMLYNKNDTVIGRIVEAYGEYFESEVAIFRQVCRPGDVVVDAGANIGALTLAMAQIVGSQGCVFAFEAQRRVHQILCANAALNSLSSVFCIHAAVGAANGELELGDIGESMQVNVGGVSLDLLSAKNVLKTPMVALDSYLSGIGRLRLIKIDVEGMELDVLHGAKKLLAQHLPTLYMENDRPEKSKALLEFLHAHHYRCYWHFGEDFNPDNFFKNPNRIFLRSFFDRGAPYLDSCGFSTNMLCIPQQHNVTLNGFREVTNPDEHPFKREYNPLFANLAQVVKAAAL